MKVNQFGLAVSAVLAFNLSTVYAKHSNVHLNALERRHQHHRDQHVSRAENGQSIELGVVDKEKRGGQCQFPYDAGLVAVTPGSSNAGWAMSPDQPCTPGNYCPYACPSGQVMSQWDPEATSYTYPQSMNGGAYCDSNGNINKPYPDQPWCVDGIGNIGCINQASGNVAFCQTVLPGNEAMLIPTNIETFAQLAVPGPSYWCGTAAHFYINPPGVSTEEACVWGSSSSPLGNWSPYVAGANMDHTGNTFVKLGWNPIYLQPGTPFQNNMPTWGVEIVCEGEGCNGLPCAIDPSQNQVNEMVGSNTDGAGGAAFCVVTVPQGVTANFVVFEGGMSGAGSSSGGSSSAVPSTSASSTYSAALSSSSQPTSSSSPPSSTPVPSVASPSSALPTSSTSTSSSQLESSSYSSSSSWSSSTASVETYLSTSSSSNSTSSDTVSSASATIFEYSGSASYANLKLATSQPVSNYDAPHVFLQNSTATSISAVPSPPSNVSITQGTIIASPTPTATSTFTGAGAKIHATILGLCMSALAALAAGAL